MTIKKRLSRLFAFALVLALMAALAVPGLANTKYVTYGNQNYGLNVYGNNTISQNRNVCLWSTQSTPAQQWYFEYCPDGMQRMKSAINKNYALNIYRYSSNYNNCDVMLWESNTVDSAVFKETSPTGGPYTIELVNYKLYRLTASSFANNADVRWQYGANTQDGRHVWWPRS